MTTATVDDRGRIYIPKEIREEFGEDYKVVKLESGIKLVPLSDDPVEGLKNAMKDSEEIDLSEIDDIVNKKAKKEIKEELK